MVAPAPGFTFFFWGGGGGRSVHFSDDVYGFITQAANAIKS